jgi:hypothetical protein
VTTTVLVMTKFNHDYNSTGPSGELKVTVAQAMLVLTPNLSITKLGNQKSNKYKAFGLFDLLCN